MDSDRVLVSRSLACHRGYTFALFSITYRIDLRNIVVAAFHFILRNICVRKARKQNKSAVMLGLKQQDCNSKRKSSYPIPLFNLM